jgi:hypothetical protein
MSFAVNGYFLPSYQVSCSEFITPASFVGCVGLPWAKRHWQLANTDTTHSLGHRMIACLEALPVIGPLVVLIERIVAAIASYWQPSPEYLFLAKKAGRGQEGCRGSISVKEADRVLEKLQERPASGIFFDAGIYHGCPSIIGTCTAMSLEFASTYFRLRKELKHMSPGSEPFLDKLRLLSGIFEKSSEEMRSRQAAYSSITVDRTVDMDISRSKIESCIKYHDFETDYCSREVDITDADLLQHEINALPLGVYFVRMLMPRDNHKLEARGHSMIYVHEEDVKFFYDNNCGLEKISKMSSDSNGLLLYERLLNVHRQWNIPMVRLYRLKPELSSNA